MSNANNSRCEICEKFVSYKVAISFDNKIKNTTSIFCSDCIYDLMYLFDPPKHNKLCIHCKKNHATTYKIFSGLDGIIYNIPKRILDDICDECFYRKISEYKFEYDVNRL